MDRRLQADGDAGGLVPAGSVSVPDHGDVRGARDDCDRIVPPHARRVPERVVGSRHAQADDVHRGSAARRCGVRRAGDRRRRPPPPAGADLRRSDAHPAPGARCLAVAQGPQRGHARRTRRRRRHLADQHARRLGNLIGVLPNRRAGGEGLRRCEPADRRLRQGLGSEPARLFVLGPRRWPRRGAAAGVDAQLPASAERHRRHGGRDLLRAVGAEPVRRCVSRTLRRGARAVAAARQT